jgi:hypothetical protein
MHVTLTATSHGLHVICRYAGGTTILIMVRHDDVRVLTMLGGSPPSTMGMHSGCTSPPRNGPPQQTCGGYMQHCSAGPQAVCWRHADVCLLNMRSFECTKYCQRSVPTMFLLRPLRPVGMQLPSHCHLHSCYHCMHGPPRRFHLHSACNRPSFLACSSCVLRPAGCTAAVLVLLWLQAAASALESCGRDYRHMQNTHAHASGFASHPFPPQYDHSFGDVIHVE